MKSGNYTEKAKYYYVLNIDKSGLPELIVTSGSGGLNSYFVYGIKNGKMIKLGECSEKGSSVPPRIRYVSRYKGILMQGWTNYVGGSWSNLYGISGSRLVRTYHAREEHYPRDKYYTGKTDKQEKKVSRSSCAAFVKKYFKSYKTYVMLNNTAANRAKSFG